MEPAFMRISPVNINGIATTRMMVVLKSKGCEYAVRNGGGCTVCGFMNHADKNITDREIVMQLDHTLSTTNLEGVEEIDLLTLGSFLNENEISADLRKELLRKVSLLDQVKRVSFESRAEYVSVSKLAESKSILGDRIVEFGIGLESSDDYIRNEVIRKGLSKRKFEQVVASLKESGCDLLVYLLIKPPHLSERAAIEDALRSVDYVFQVAQRHGVKTRVAFEPVFVTNNTYLEKLFLKSQYRLVSLWSVVDIIIKSHTYGDIFVGLSDENLSHNRTTGSCSKCYGTIIEAIEEFNRTQDITNLLRLDCECRAGYLRDLENGRI